MYVGKSSLTSKPERWVARLETLLLPNEAIRAICSTANVTTKFDGVAVTNMRIGTFSSMELKSGKGFVEYLSLDEISQVTLTPKKLTKDMFNLIFELKGKPERNFVNLKATDAEALKAAIYEYMAEGTESVIHQAGASEDENRTEFLDMDDTSYGLYAGDVEEVDKDPLMYVPQISETLGIPTQESNYEAFENNRAQTKPERSNFSLGLKFTLRGSRRAKKNRRKLLELQESVHATKGAEANFRNEFDQVLATRGLDAITETVLFEVENCYLIEVRKGARVTHRESSSSGSGSGGSIGFGGVRVGGGSYGGSSTSTTISYPAPDILQVIDQGNFIITNRKVSFMGGMFTKTTAFVKMVGYQYSDHQILIAPVTGTKVWICEFPRIDLAWLANLIIGTALDTDNRLLDSKALSTYRNAEDFLTSEFNKQCIEIQLAIERLEKEITKVQLEFLELEEEFGGLAAWSRRRFY
jgi:uncharacterized membrane protein YgcG